MLYIIEHVTGYNPWLCKAILQTSLPDGTYQNFSNDWEKESQFVSNILNILLSS